MASFFYRTRLRQDLYRWVARGWVSQSGSEAILEELQQRWRQRYRPASMALAAGMILVLAGVIAFVGSNWDGMPRLLRLLLLFGVMAALYAGGGCAACREPHPRQAHSWLAESCFFLAAGLFGANIFLIAQMYNIASGDILAAIMLWCAGCLVSAWGARSPAALYLAFAALLVWLLVWNEKTAAFASLFWFLPPWGAAIFTAWRWRWRSVIHPAAITGLAFVFQCAEAAGGLRAIERPALFGSVLLAVFTLGLLLSQRLSSGSSGASWFAQKLPTLQRYALTPALLAFAFLYGSSSAGEHAPHHYALGGIAAAGLAVGAGLACLLWQKLLPLRDAAAIAALALGFAAQPYLSPVAAHFAFFWLHAAYVLALILWLVDFGLRGDNYWQFFGYAFFAAQFLHIYIRAFGSLLQTSIFLMLGGVILIAIAFAVRRFHLRTAGQREGAAGPTP